MVPTTTMAANTMANGAVSLPERRNQRNIGYHVRRGSGICQGDAGLYETRVYTFAGMNVARFRVPAGDRKPLDRERSDFTGGFDSKEDAQKHLDRRLQLLEALQDKLYGQRRHALLVILQGMDTAGKDSTINHVFRGFNPAGLAVHSFKQPSSEELGHDFLWRTCRALPARGQIGVFNRSYYEEVLVVRVHPELLENECLPKERVASKIWSERFEDINAFERHLWRSGTVVVKFFLKISRKEQEKRLLERIEDPSKNWKFSPGDLPERARWSAYMAAYADALGATSTKHAPWYVIPADHKWFAHAAVAETLYETLSGLDLRFPALSPAQRRELAQARKELARQKR
jgi:PPK2 family polyphosphate:nucleotide phosphotransferase